MHIVFEQPELDWLHHYMEQLILAAHKHKDEALMRVVSKMRYKFGPGAKKVNLSIKERTVLANVVGFRMKRLGGGGALTTTEYTMLVGLDAKL